MCKGFEDTEDAIAYAHQLMTRAQLAGCLNIDGHIPSREERALQIEIRVFVKKIEGAHRRLQAEISISASFIS